jgi:uncharacterized OB-fold protein
MADEYKKPLPLLDGMTEQFYAFCKDGELRFQRCGACKTWRHVPREMCPQCGSMDWDWQPSSGRGTLFTWTTAARSLHPAFADAAPYAPIVVEMEEGVRLVSEMIDCSPDELEIDAAVEVVFERVTDDVTLPKFRRIAGESH